MKVLVASENPVKVEAVKRGLSALSITADVIGKNPGSPVSRQPIGEETFAGAKGRVERAKSLWEGFDAYVGIEGGIFLLNKKVLTMGVVYAEMKGKGAFALSPGFELPRWVWEEIKEGKELGEVVGELVGDKDVKRSLGAVGVLTKGALDRAELYKPAVVLAFSTLMHPLGGGRDYSKA